MRKIWLYTLRLALTACAGAMVLVPVAAQPPQTGAKPSASAHKTNWSAMVTRTAGGGFMVGNPAAPVHVIAYLSYTCPHCADFDAQARAPLMIGMITPGKGSYEVRPFQRNGIDVTVALLAECGPPAKFFANTQLLLSTQATWMEPLGKLSDAQKARWDNPDFAARMRAIASDLGLYTIMERRGYDRVELDRCLANKPLADQLAKHTQDAVDRDFVDGTPAFVLNGVPLAATHTWESLKPQIEVRLH